MAGARFAAAILRVGCLGVLIGLVPGAARAVGPDSESPASASNCLTSPKGTTPAGQRWYYRVERTTKRHCWYSRAGMPRKAVAHASPKTGSPETPDTAELLQLSVANARAEADLSALPRSASGAPRDLAQIIPTDRPWMLAERWSEHLDSPQTNPLAPTQMTQSSAETPAEPPSDVEDASSESLLDVAAGALGLVELATVLTAVIVRRRKHRRADDWHFAQRGAQGIRPRLH